MGHIRLASAFAVFLVLLSPAAANAQTPAPQAAEKPAQKPADQAAQKPVEKSASYTIGKIVFKGEMPYSQSALEAASGLKPGASLTNTGLQAAAERLMTTGAFGEISATLDGPAKSTDVIFTVTAVAAEHVLRPSFDNFVWFSREELASGIQKRVPLFNGTVPEGGSVQDAVQDALKQMLAEKGVKATVDSELVAPHPGQPFRLAEYRVTSPVVHLRKLTVTGAPAAVAAATDAVAQSLAGREYNDGLAEGFSERVLAPYRNAGYLEAALTNVNTTIASSSATRVDVDVAATLKAGERYQLSKLEWAGSPVMSADAFAASAKVHPGEVASQQLIRESVEVLDAAYRSQGYLDVIFNAAPKFDTVNRQVAFTISAVQGPQYKLREVTVLNLTPAQRKEFDSVWQLKRGDVYNAGYVTTFLKNHPQLSTLRDYTASFKVSEEPDGGVLDLTMTFRKDVPK